MSRTFRIGPEGEEDAGKSEALLTKLGVSVRNAQGEFRSFSDIIVDVNSKWGAWGNITQMNVAQTLAGRHTCLNA